MQNAHHTVYLLLGSNEGDRIEWLQSCLVQLKQKAGNIKTISKAYQTAAWGLEAQPDFLNMAVCIETALAPRDLLAVIQDIEMELGRQRTVKWGQRTLDIDMLFYDDRIIHTPDLNVPHPYLHERRFVLVPMNEIATSFIHPVLKETIATLLSKCPDSLPVQPFEKSPLIP